MIKILLFLVFLVLVGNMVLLDYFWVNEKNELNQVRAGIKQVETRIDEVKGSDKLTEAAFPETTPIKADNACPQSCVTQMNSAIANIKIPAGAPVPTPIVSTTPKGEFIIPFGTATVSTIGNWFDAFSAQASFDSRNYPPVKAFYFEVVMHIPDATGEMRAKLIDDSTPFSYDGQVLKTQSGTGQFLSVQVPLISGQKTYHVQLYSSIATGILDSARIRIVTQ